MGWMEEALLRVARRQIGVSDPLFLVSDRAAQEQHVTEQAEQVTNPMLVRRGHEHRGGIGHCQKA